MLKASEQERQTVLDYMASEAKDERVELVQKVYSERVFSAPSDIWDVHTDKERWWVIVNPMMNLYSQKQFPNMDLALTFHVGMCLRVPRSERPSVEDSQVEPFMACWRAFQEASEAKDRAEEIEDFQAVGVRCREALISLVHLAQDAIEIAESTERPKKSDFKAWVDVIASVVYQGESNKERRGLLKSVADSAWSFTNWLTHSRNVTFYDAESACSVTEEAMALLSNVLVRHLREVPDSCPACGSFRLYPERAHDPESPDDLYERPVCRKCAWRGEGVLIPSEPLKRTKSEKPPEGECYTMEPPLREGAHRRDRS